MDKPEGRTEGLSVGQQVEIFLESNDALNEQVKNLEYGTLTFHIRGGKVYKATVEKSLLFTANAE